jgi:calcineurin-like phosphoesterase family protein
MDQTLIKNWNELVKPDDIVFHLGDFAFKGLYSVQRYRDQLNGKIYLIRGNHDPKQMGQLTPYFDGVFDYLEIDVADNEARQGWQNITLCHYALRVWNKSHHGSFSLYGHSHGTLPDDPNSRSFDVGVDCHDYKPISYKRVKEIMAAKSFQPVDHHGNSE